ncbi:unnamed protein product, partial [Amoebophrya sp. A25]|eukprot:GSA25T00016384001.1
MSTTGTCSAEAVATVQYWNDRWITGQTGWHRLEPKSHFLDVIAKAEENTKTPGGGLRVLLPLCGASPDIVWFAKQPWVTQVVGIEFAPDAISIFVEHNKGIVATETKVKFTKKDVDDKKNDVETSNEVVKYNFNKAESKDEDPFHKISIYIADALDAPYYLTPATMPFDLVFDNAALVAIPVNLRVPYIGAMKKCLKPDARYYLSTITYPPGSKQPPPHSIDGAGEGELEKLFFSEQQRSKVEQDEGQKMNGGGGADGKMIECLIPKMPVPKFGPG